MYDMYPWDKTAAARPGQDRAMDEHPRTRRRDLKGADPAPSAVQAVQVALDRRDNGGDAVGAPDRQ